MTEPREWFEIERKLNPSFRATIHRPDEKDAEDQTQWFQFATLEGAVNWLEPHFKGTALTVVEQKSPGGEVRVLLFKHPGDMTEWLHGIFKGNEK